MKEKKPKDIRKRTFEYSLRAIKLYQSLQEGKDSAGWVISKQYLRSATAVGANMEEAQAGESRKDFIHKCSISLKEAKESLYWLRLLAESGIIAAKWVEPLILETEELVAVIAKIIVNTKKKKK